VRVLPVWLATPSLCKTLTRYTLPALPGAVSFSSLMSLPYVRILDFFFLLPSLPHCVRMG